MLKANKTGLERFIAAYMECALWSSLDDNGDPLDESDLADEWSPEAIAQIEADCRAFLDANEDLIDESGMSPDQAGHDFWLTRNGHGTGFWDRGLPNELGKALTDAAHTWGECTPYVGDDRKLYLA